MLNLAAYKFSYAKFSWKVKNSISFKIIYTSKNPTFQIKVLNISKNSLLERFKIKLIADPYFLLPQKFYSQGLNNKIQFLKKSNDFFFLGNINNSNNYLMNKNKVNSIKATKNRIKLFPKDLDLTTFTFKRDISFFIPVRTKNEIKKLSNSLFSNYFVFFIFLRELKLKQEIFKIVFLKVLKEFNKKENNNLNCLSNNLIIINQKEYFKNYILFNPCPKRAYKFSQAKFKCLRKKQNESFNKTNLMILRWHFINERINLLNFYSIKSQVIFLESLFIIKKIFFNDSFQQTDLSMRNLDGQLKLILIPFVNRQIIHFVEFLSKKTYFLKQIKKENLKVYFLKFEKTKRIKSSIDNELAMISKNNLFYNFSKFSIAKFIFYSAPLICERFQFNWKQRCTKWEILQKYFLNRKFNNLNSIKVLFFNSKYKNNSLKIYNFLNKLLFKKLFDWMKTKHNNNSNSDILNKYWFFLYRSNSDQLNFPKNLIKTSSYFCLKKKIKEIKKNNAASRHTNLAMLNLEVNFSNLRTNFFLRNQNLNNFFSRQLNFHPPKFFNKLNSISIFKNTQLNYLTLPFKICFQKQNHLKKKDRNLSDWTIKLKNNFFKSQCRFNVFNTNLAMLNLATYKFSIAKFKGKYNFQTWYLKQYKSKKLQLKSNSGHLIFNSLKYFLNNFAKKNKNLDFSLLNFKKNQNSKIFGSYYYCKTFFFLKKSNCLTFSYKKMKISLSIKNKNLADWRSLNPSFTNFFLSSL